MGTDNKLQIIIEAVNKTKGELDQIKDQVNDLGKGIKEAGSHTDSFTGGIGKMAAAFGIANIGMAVLQKGVSEFVSIIKKGLSAVEDFQLSIIENASVITTFAKNTEGANIADVYKNAKEYATNLVNKIEEWDAKTIATGKDLGIINQTLIQGGVLIDYTNKKQEEGFLAIANAVKILTAGQNFEIQGRQEVRALLDGEVRANSRLATLMDAQLNGSLKEQIAIWKQEGTVIEHVGELLSGFAQGANDLETTWTAVGSTLETIATKILRGAFGPVFEDLVGRAKELSDYFLDHKEVMEEISSILSEGISATWITIRNTVQDVYNLLVPLAPLLGLISSIVGTSVTGWSYILAILGPITERVGNLLSSMLEVAKAGYMVYEALYRAASFDFKGAANALGSAKDAWMNAGKQAGKAVSAGLYNEINVKMQELYGAGEKVPGGTKTTPTRPALRQPEPSGTKDKKGKDRTEAFGQTQIELQGELEALNAGFSEYEKAYIQFRTKIDKDKERFKTVPGATDFLTNILGKYDEALYNKYLTQAEQKAKERMDKESVAEVEAQQKLIDVKLDYDSKYNAELLKRHDITEEEAANRSIAIEVKKLESAQAVVAVKQSTAKTDAEANTLAGEYLLIEDKIINTKKIGVFLSEEAAKKDKEQFLDLLISYQQNNLEVAKIVGSLQEEATIQMGILTSKTKSSQCCY